MNRLRNKSVFSRIPINSYNQWNVGQWLDAPFLPFFPNKTETSCKHSQRAIRDFAFRSCRRSTCQTVLFEYLVCLCVFERADSLWTYGYIYQKYCLLKLPINSNYEQCSRRMIASEAFGKIPKVLGSSLIIQLKVSFHSCLSSRNVSLLTKSV